MPHIGSRAEYGLHCLLHLVGRGQDDAPSARDLAAFQGVSASYLAKLFTKLEKAGLVVSSEGIRGGFRLARPARDISVLEIVDALEGASRCSSAAKSAATAPSMAMPRRRRRAAAPAASTPS